MTQPNDTTQDESKLDPLVKEAVAGVIESTPASAAATDAIEARLSEVLTRYEKGFSDLMDRYHAVLNGVEMEVEPVEAMLRRIQNTTFTGNQVIELMAQYEKASGWDPRLTATQIVQLFKPYLTGMRQNGG